MTGDNPSLADDRPVALVTGASRGIGRAIAIELARAGYDLVINYRSNQSAGDEARTATMAAADDQRARAELCQADVAEAAGRNRLLSFTRENFDRLDLLVNNAGIAPDRRVDLLDADESDFDRMIEVNLKGPYFLTQAAARWMIQQKTAGKAKNYRPAIVNISSVSAYAASPERGAYCVSKAGLAMMTRLYALSLADKDISVFEIRPGVIATDMTAKVKDKYDRMIAAGLTPIRRWGTPADVALAVAAVATGSFPFSTGEVINVDGGFHLRQL